MAAALSEDLRKRLVAAVSEGSSARAAAARFQVSPAAVNIVRRARETGSTEPARAVIVDRCWRIMKQCWRS